jgi:hypothetical protein
MTPEKLAEKIINMAELDQEVRKGNNLNWDKIRQIDKQNRIAIKRIIKKYGYINSKIYGEKAAKSAWILIQHFPRRSIKSMENYLNFIKANDKTFDKKTLVLFEDRINVYKKQPQIYGTQAYCPPNSDTYYFREIKDVANIDKIRKAIGLETLAEYAKSMEEDFGDKFVLPADYKPQ